MLNSMTMERVKQIVNPTVNNGRVNLAHEAYLRWLDQQNNTDYTMLHTYRDYYGGEHGTQLTKRLRAFLQVKPGTRFNINFCAIPVDVLKERLTIEGFDAEGQSEQFSEWWAAARMDAVQKAVHLSTFRDGRTFVIVDWDNEKSTPRFNHHLAYDGDHGVRVVYDDEDPNIVKFAVNVWKVEDQGIDGYGKMKRANFYTPDAIYKFKQSMNGGDWQPYIIDGEDWPIQWTATGTEGGDPLGVPVVGFYNGQDGDNDGVSELHNIIGPQNSLNKHAISYIAGADMSGLGMIFKSGGSDPGNMVVAPGQIGFDENPETKYTFPNGPDLTGLENAVHGDKLTIAQLSRTPLHYFQITGAVSSSESQKAGDSGLVSKVEDRSVPIGNSWEDCMYMARRLHNVWGNGRMDENVIISAKWASFERVDKRSTEKLEAETLEVKARTFNSLIMDRVPRALAARLAGYDEETVEEIAASEARTLARDQVDVPVLPEGLTNG